LLTSVFAAGSSACGASGWLGGKNCFSQPNSESKFHFAEASVLPVLSGGTSR